MTLIYTGKMSARASINSNLLTYVGVLLAINNNTQLATVCKNSSYTDVQ